MKPLLAIAFAVLAPLASARALEEADVRKILDAPHSREGLLEEMKMFPAGREFKVVVEVTVQGEDPNPPTENITKVKFVDGKYFVASFHIKEIEKDFHSVVTYDREAKVYRRWTLPEGDKVVESVGTSTKGSRAIAWRVVTETEVDGDTEPLVTIEQLSDDSITWTELIELDDGKLLRFDGTATVIKKG